MRKAHNPCRRLHTLPLRIYLRYRLWSARCDADAAEAELATAPARLRTYRAYISATLQRLNKLEGRP